MTALSLQVSNDPMPLTELNVLDLQCSRLRASERTADQHSEHRLIPHLPRSRRPIRPKQALPLFRGQPISDTNAEAARSFHSSDPCRKIRAQQAAISCFIREPTDRRQSEVDRSGSVLLLFKGDSVTGHHGLVKRQPWLRTIPVDEFADGMLIGSLRTSRSQAVQHGGLRLFQIRQL